MSGTANTLGDHFFDLLANGAHRVFGRSKAGISARRGFSAAFESPIVVAVASAHFRRIDSELAFLHRDSDDESGDGAILLGNRVDHRGHRSVFHDAGDVVLEAFIFAIAFFNCDHIRLNGLFLKTDYIEL
ncbi:MAG: hypothetical protein V1814_00585 [Candidatus Moraniibacteriota bacterium]